MKAVHDSGQYEKISYPDRWTGLQKHSSWNSWKTERTQNGGSGYEGYILEMAFIMIERTDLGFCWTVLVRMNEMDFFCGTDDNTEVGSEKLIVRSNDDKINAKVKLVESIYTSPYPLAAYNKVSCVYVRQFITTIRWQEASESNP